MICAWQELLDVLPSWIRSELKQINYKSITDIRLFLGQYPAIHGGKSVLFLSKRICEDDLKFCINTASAYSPWAASTIREGYLTAPGGHRMGICGTGVLKEREITGIREPTSICIRVAKDYPGIADQIPEFSGSILILGPPGSGKTTLLRDLIRHLKEPICVVDEKGELFPRNSSGFIFDSGIYTHILTAIPKEQGIWLSLRNLGPKRIALDEITAPDDCVAFQRCLWSGVQFITTIHASGIKELYARPDMKSLLEQGVFEQIIVMRQDRSWYMERIKI